MSTGFMFTPSKMAAAPTLSTPSLTLREPGPSDAEPLWRHLATEDVSRFMSEPPSNPDGFRRFFEWVHGERASGRCVCYAIWPAGFHEPVGLIQARGMEAALGTAEWGFSISRQFWGTGLFIEAARAVADFLFREVGIERLEARVAVSNMRAARALTKLGAESEGTLRLAFERRGTRFDQALWAISRDAWLSRVAAPIAAIEPAASGDEPRSSADERPLSRPLAVPRTLVQPGCTLRALVDDDAASLAALLSAPAVARFLPPPPNGVEGFRRFVSWSLRQWDKGRSFVFGIVPPNSERAVGILQLHTLNPGLGIAEWGFALGEPYWGTGLFMRGAELMLQFAFEVIKVRRLEARTAVDNDRGNGVLRKLGATPECRLRRSFLLEENHQDDMLWALLDEEWRRRSGRRVDAASSTPAAVGMSGDVASVSEPA